MIGNYTLFCVEWVVQDQWNNIEFGHLNSSLSSGKTLWGLRQVTELIPFLLVPWNYLCVLLPSAVESL